MSLITGLFEPVKHVAYLLKDGVYTCSSNLQAEKELYERFVVIVQGGVDAVHKIHPEWTETRVREYIGGDSIGQVMLRGKECLESNGYDTSGLPHVNIPELPLPGLATAVGIVIGLSVLAYMKWKNRSYGDSGLSYKV